MLGKQIQTAFFYPLILFLFSVCNCYSQKVEQEEVLPPLDSGVVYYQRFDSLIHLKGEKIMDDALSRNIRSLFLKDTLLVIYMWDYEWDSQKKQPIHKFKHYSLFDMQFSKNVEQHFSVFMGIIPTVDSTLLGYLLDYEINRKQQPRLWKPRLHKYDLSGKLTLVDSIMLPFEIGDVVNNKVTSITHIGNADFIYRKDSLIVRASIQKDTVLTENLFRLPMNPYRGQLIVNPAKNRMVFAYGYYHLFHIMDLEAQTVKTVDFKNGNHQYQFEKNFCIDCVNPNTIYYCAAFAGNNYFYLLYWGYPYEVIYGHAKGWEWSKKEKKYVKTNEYQQNIPNVVEQYDWNGNLVAQYLLEGNPSISRHFFVVDEKMQRFYLLSAECYDTDFVSYESLMVYSFSENRESKDDK